MPIPITLVRTALRARVLTVGSLPPDNRRAWENTGFDPGTDITAPWMRETLLPGRIVGLANDLVVGPGIVQYDVFVPHGDSVEAGETIRDAIAAAFDPGTFLDLGNTHALQIVSVDPSGQIDDDPWFGSPLRIQWRAHGDRI